MGVWALRVPIADTYGNSDFTFHRPRGGPSQWIIDVDVHTLAGPAFGSTDCHLGASLIFTTDLYVSSNRLSSGAALAPGRYSLVWNLPANGGPNGYFIQTAVFIRVGGTDTFFGRWTHDAQYPDWVGFEVPLSCAPDVASMHVYLNSIEQRVGTDWLLMAPDGTSALWRVRSLAAMDEQVGDLIEVQYACAS